MTVHSAFVPSEPWVFHSPDVRHAGEKVDLGLLAEALVFYDRVYYAINGEEAFVALVQWFKREGRAADLVALLNDGVIVPYYYAFYTNAVNVRGVWDVLNMQDTEAATRPVFEERVVGTGRLRSVVGKRSLRDALVRAAVDQHVEVKAEEFGATLLNARADYGDQDRAALLVQLIYDELYRDLGLLTPPTISVDLDSSREGLTTLRWNRDLGEFKRRLGPSLDVHAGTPLAAAAFGVKTLWSAGNLGADLYVGAPLTHYLALKVADFGSMASERAIVSELKLRAEFPDLRSLVNHREIGVGSILTLRKKGAKFREWLATEADLERDAVLSYLGQLAQEAGWKRGLGKVIHAAGLLGGAAAGAAVSGSIGAVGGAVAGEALAFVIELASRLDQGWTPRVFGQAVTKEVSGG